MAFVIKRLALWAGERPANLKINCRRRRLRGTAAHVQVAP